VTRARATERDAARWVILVVLFVARTTMAYQFQSVASTAPLLAERLGIGYAEIGALIGLYMLPGIAVSLPGGLLTARFGDKSIAALGLALMAVGGVAMGVAGAADTVFAGRLASGVGAVLFNLVIMKMATDWFAGREIAVAMGAILASWPVGIGVGLLTQPALAEAFGPGAVFDAAAALTMLALVLIVACYRDPPESDPAALVAPKARLTRSEAAAIVIAGLLWGAFNVGLVVFFSFTPPLLVERGLTLVAAASATSLGLWASALSLPLGGLVVTRLGRPDLSIVAFSIATGAAMALLPVLGAAAVPSILFGLFIGPPAAAIMTLPARALAPAHRATGLGVFYTVYYATMAGGPALAGWLRDASGTAAAATLYGALLFLVSPLLLALFLAVLPRGPVGVTSPRRAS
jgi:predicted MFS family arabinose efflux permease